VELRDYGRAVACRWAWLVVAGVIGTVVTALGAGSPVTYQSTVSLYVGASVVSGDEDPAYAALVQTRVLPSVAALARSSAVLQHAAASVSPSASPAGLTAAVTATPQADGSVLTVTATDPDPERARALAAAVGLEVQREARLLFPGTGGSPLTVGVLGAPGPASPAAAVGAGPLAVLGGLAGIVLAAVLAGLAELARPRVRGRRDVRAVTAAPVALLPAAGDRGRRLLPFARGSRQAAAAQRPEELLRLRTLLASWASSGARIAVTSPGSCDAAARLIPELSLGGSPAGGATDDVDLLLVDDLRRLPAHESVAGVLVVADGRRTTRDQLTQAVGAVGASGRQLLGVVVDGLLPPRAAWRARLTAAVRGDARWSLELWEDGVRPATRSRGERSVAAGALAALGFALPLPMALSTGLITVVCLLPLWAPVVRRTRGATALFTVAGLGVSCGVLLAWLHASDHGVDSHGFRLMTTLILTGVCGVGLIVWARELLSMPEVGAAYGVGALAYGVLATPDVPNPWKFTLSFPVMIIALSIVAARRRPVVTVGTLLILGLVSVAEDYRSGFSFCVLAALLVLWQARRTRGTGRVHWWAVLPSFVAFAAAGYWVLTRLLLSGVLGGQVQARTALQIAQSGSLLLGGRPEWTATWALMRDNPLGFGLGTVPTAHDVAIAKAGLAVTHIPTVNDYLVHQLLDGSVHLHSIVADLWAALGPVGVLLGLLMAALMVHALAERILEGNASGLVCLLVPMGLWDLAFGPLQDNLPTVTLALGLLLLDRLPRRRDEAAARAPSTGTPERLPVPAGAR
jgi:capsular polysaccharide biosynthesis protein